MKKLTLILSFLSLNAFAQKKDPNELVKPIVAEGKHLYRLEMAAWHGTDIILEKIKDKAQIGGYVTYVENDLTKFVFVDKSTPQNTLAMVTFDSTFNPATANIIEQKRSLNEMETQLLQLRNSAIEIALNDTFFQHYKNTNFNFIPLISGNERKVYILTAPTIQNIVLFGNDYLLKFDNKNTLISKQKLHNNLIPIEYEDGDIEQEAYHSHNDKTGIFPTATDICTMMLYGKIANWKRHSINSKKYVSIWNVTDNSIFIIDNKIAEKINKDIENRNK